MIKRIPHALALRVFLIVSLLAFLNSALPLREASAQSVTLTSPTTPSTVAEGRDFAADELLNSWDFNEKRDIGFKVNFNGNSVGVDSGIWRGISPSSRDSGYVFPLFGGYIGMLLTEGLPGDRQLPRFGVNHKIDSSKYTLLSMRSNHSHPSTRVIYWSNDASNSYFPDISQFRAVLDGVFLDRRASY